MLRQADLGGARSLTLVPQAALAGLVNAFPRPNRLADAGGADRCKTSFTKYCLQKLTFDLSWLHPDSKF
jgi:hypothetical protein